MHGANLLSKRAVPIYPVPSRVWGDTLEYHCGYATGEDLHLKAFFFLNQPNGYKMAPH